MLDRKKDKCYIKIRFQRTSLADLYNLGLYWFRRGCGSLGSHPQTPGLRKNLELNIKANNEDYALAAA